jgi:hypothetical protein
VNIPARFAPTAQQVRELRETSGAGMMECKRKLVLEKLEPAIADVENPALRDILTTLLMLATHKL